MHKLKNNSIWRNFQSNVDNNARLLWVNFMTLCDWSKKKENMPPQPIRSRKKNKQTKKKRVIVTRVFPALRVVGWILSPHSRFLIFSCSNWSFSFSALVLDLRHSKFTPIACRFFWEENLLLGFTRPPMNQRRLHRAVLTLGGDVFGTDTPAEKEE